MLIIAYSADIGYYLGDREAFVRSGAKPYACLVFVIGEHQITALLRLGLEMGGASSAIHAKHSRIQRRSSFFKDDGIDDIMFRVELCVISLL